MHRALRLEGALLATVHDPHFAKLDIVKTNNRVMLAVHNVKSKSFWCAVYILLQCVFLALRLLRYSDSNISVMDKLYYLLDFKHDPSVILQIQEQVIIIQVFRGRLKSYSDSMRQVVQFVHHRNV